MENLFEDGTIRRFRAMCVTTTATGFLPRKCIWQTKQVVEEVGLSAIDALMGSKDANSCCITRKHGFEVVN